MNGYECLYVSVLSVGCVCVYVDVMNYSEPFAVIFMLNSNTSLRTFDLSFFAGATVVVSIVLVP